MNTLDAAGDLALVRGGRPLLGSVRVPGDKSLSHRSLMFAALAEGTSTITGCSNGDDVVRTGLALAAYGVAIDTVDQTIVVRGGVSRFTEPERPIDVGNSGTGFRLLLGIAARLPFLSVFVGDASIHRRPMDRVTIPLRAMGAQIDGRADGRLAPIVVRGGGLEGIEYAPPVASAQVKSAILLAGLGASGTTSVRERPPTRRHTEELLELVGAPPTVVGDAAEQVVSVRASVIEPFSIDVPGDPSQAAFLVVAALIVPGSDLTIEQVYVGPGRAGFIEVLKRMGGAIEVTPRSATTADLHVRHSSLQATRVAGREVPSLIDEIPVLSVAAAFATGRTEFADAAELRVKESDRIATTVGEL